MTRQLYMPDKNGIKKYFSIHTSVIPKDLVYKCEKRIDFTDFSDRKIFPHTEYYETGYELLVTNLVGVYLSYKDNCSKIIPFITKQMIEFRDIRDFINNIENTYLYHETSQKLINDFLQNELKLYDKDNNEVKYE